jgi:hypothetical protein
MRKKKRTECGKWYNEADYPHLKWSKNTGIVGSQKWTETDDKTIKGESEQCLYLEHRIFKPRNWGTKELNFSD